MQNKIRAAKLLKTKYFIYFLLGICLVSCKYTEHIPEERYLLWDQDVYENGERNPNGSAESILKQQPNQKLFGVLMPKVAVYNWGDGTDSSFFSKVGEAPVVFDSLKAKRATEQIRYYYVKKGYFGAVSELDVEFRDNKRWAEVHYRVTTGPQYSLRNYSVKAENQRIMGLISFFEDESFIKEGKPYDEYLLDKERTRLTTIFKNHGYYAFSKSYINFEADSTVGSHKVDVKMVISKRPVAQGDSTVYLNHEQYHFAKIYVQPDYDYALNDTPGDTIGYRDYIFIYDSLAYAPRYFTDAIHFRSGDLYTRRDIRETYAHLVGYQAFASTEVKLTEGERDSLGPTLDALIHIKPLPKRTFTIEPELTTTNGFAGVNMGITWTNRNIFGAGEALEIKLNGGVDYQPTVTGDRSSRTVEFGGEVGIRFPRFLLPISTVGLLPKRMRPSSKISLSANRTSRSEFDRETFGGKLSYFWNESSVKSHTIDLLDVSFSRLFEINDVFRNALSEFQVRSFQSEFVSASRWTFVYNGQLDGNIKHPSFFRSSLEVAGTSTWLGESINSGNISNDGGTLDSIAGVPYYQYTRLELDYRHFYNITSKLTWANRINAGYILPFGNSTIDSGATVVRQPPFSKFFFMGGSNDVRAWSAYRLGAGSQGNTDYDQGRDTSFAIGTVKFLLSTELRFPIYGFLEGAVFVDGGNIFLSGGLEDLQENDGTGFSMNSLVKNMALGTGFGIRLNLDYFVLRADVGVKMRDPGLIGVRSPWVIQDVAWRPRNWTFNIALGYPF